MRASQCLDGLDTILFRTCVRHNIKDSVAAWHQTPNQNQYVLQGSRDTVGTDHVFEVQLRTHHNTPTLEHSTLQ